MIMFAFGIINANIRYLLLLFEYEDFFFFFGKEKIGLEIHQSG